MNSVVIKSFPNGIDVRLDDSLPFDELKNIVEEKFIESAKFFKGARLAVSFSNRLLTSDEELSLVDVISKATEIEITCIIDRNPESNQIYLRAANRFAGKDEDTAGQVYKGNLRGGQVVESKGSIIILGNVNPGAVVRAGGSVVVLGTIYGAVEAGHIFEEDDDDMKIQDDGIADMTVLEQNFVACLDMKPCSIVIAGNGFHISEKHIKLPLLSKTTARIVFIKDGQLYLEQLSKEFLLSYLRE